MIQIDGEGTWKNLIFELGRAAAEYQIEPDLGILLLKHYQEDFI